MKSLKFNYLPDSSVDLRLSSPSIKKYYGNLFSNYKNEVDENDSYFYKFKLLFRSCSKGEFYRKEMSMFIFH